jgi:hypothetical protein
MSDGYSYEDYLESGEISNPLAADVEPDSNEYTNNEIRDSLGTDAEYSKSIARGIGIDLNAEATGNFTIETSRGNDAGEDLNDGDTEQLDFILDNFKEDNWNDLSLEEQKESMADLADYVAADTGNENPPEIVFRNDMADGMYGGYSPETNKIEINVNMLGDSKEAADTVTHEMWHAHQEQAANDPGNPRAQEYREGFDNYISPEYDFEAYENQMVEAEAREYAQGFKDRLKGAA